jgi:hypothetical protein
MPRVARADTVQPETGFQLPDDYFTGIAPSGLFHIMPRRLPL